MLVSQSRLQVVTESCSTLLDHMHACVCSSPPHLLKHTRKGHNQACITGGYSWWQPMSCLQQPILRDAIQTSTCLPSCELCAANSDLQKASHGEHCSPQQRSAHNLPHCWTARTDQHKAHASVTDTIAQLHALAHAAQQLQPQQRASTYPTASQYIQHQAGGCKHAKPSGSVREPGSSRQAGCAKTVPPHKSLPASQETPLTLPAQLPDITPTHPAPTAPPQCHHPHPMPPALTYLP